MIPWQESLLQAEIAAKRYSHTRRPLSAGVLRGERRIYPDSSARCTRPKNQEGKGSYQSQSMKTALKQTEYVVSIVPSEEHLGAQVTRELEAALGRDLVSFDLRCVRCGAVELELRVRDPNVGDPNVVRAHLSEILNRGAFRGAAVKVDFADSLRAGHRSSQNVQILL